MRNSKWVRLLAYVTGSVNQELLLRNEHVAAENRILRAKLPSRLRLSQSVVDVLDRAILFEREIRAPLPGWGECNFSWPIPAAAALVSMLRGAHSFYPAESALIDSGSEQEPHRSDRGCGDYGQNRQHLP